jgi:hypothetical protein
MKIATKTNFSPAADRDDSEQGSSTEPPPVVVEDNPGSSTAPPKQSSPNKKERTITEVDLMPTERQKNCPHPPSEIVILADNVTICHHCYGLLDDNLKLVSKEKPVENVCAA